MTVKNQHFIRGRHLSMISEESGKLTMVEYHCLIRDSSIR